MQRSSCQRLPCVVPTMPYVCLSCKRRRPETTEHFRGSAVPQNRRLVSRITLTISLVFKGFLGQIVRAVLGPFLHYPFRSGALPLPRSLHHIEQQGVPGVVPGVPGSGKTDFVRHA